MKYKDYYKILDVDRDTSTGNIKKAYRRLARKYHPDVSREKNAEERFKEISEAYEVLKDPEKRQAYDRLGTNWRAGQEFRPPPGWQDIFGGASAGFSMGGFSDFFDSLFGGGIDRTAHRSESGFQSQGDPQLTTIDLSLEEAYRGVRKKIRLSTGKVLSVKLPAGISPGQQLRLAGQGTKISRRGAPDDLYLKVNIKPHSRFRVEGRDVFIDIPITPWEAALGAKVQVPTLGGRVDIKVPAGSQSGRKMRLQGRGLPGQPNGDQFVMLYIMTPPADTQRAHEFYQRMARELAYNPRSEL